MDDINMINPFSYEILEIQFSDWPSLNTEVLEFFMFDRALLLTIQHDSSSWWLWRPLRPLHRWRIVVLINFSEKYYWLLQVMWVSGVSLYSMITGLWIHSTSNVPFFASLRCTLIIGSLLTMSEVPSVTLPTIFNSCNLGHNLTREAFGFSWTFCLPSILLVLFNGSLSLFPVLFHSVLPYHLDTLLSSSSISFDSSL